MKTHKLTKEFSTQYFSKVGGSALDALCRKILFKKLALIKYGKIELVEDDGTSHTFGNDALSTVSTKMFMHRSEAYSRIALGGSIGAGESYRDGDWSTGDDSEHLTNLIRLFVLNRETLAQLEDGVGSLVSPVQKFLHKLRKNTLTGSKENIKAHYDIGNDFFQLFLDPTMMYSCGIFKEESSSLEEASVEKIDRICRKLRLKPHHTVIEIGTGWGSFAIHAARNYGVHVTTTTISDQQYNFAKERIESAGLTDKITLLKEDYRNLTGTYDKLVSIEMIEAVGLDHLDVYFKKCDSLLKEDGEMLLQAITIQDQFYESAKKNVDFIQTHIFPGSGIPSIGSISSSLTKTSMRIAQLENFGNHYARTLNAWGNSLKNNKHEIFKLGYPEKLYHLWQFYFSYCEGAFIEKSIGVAQLQLLKPKSIATSLFDLKQELIHE